MNEEDLELLNEFVIASLEQIEQSEPDLMALDPRAEVEPEPEGVNRIFRAVHSVKGAAGFFGLKNIGALSHTMENLLSLFREGALRPSGEMIDALLSGVDRLRGMLESITHSDEQDISADMRRLKAFLDAPRGALPAEDPPVVEVAPPIAEHKPAEVKVKPPTIEDKPPEVEVNAPPAPRAEEVGEAQKGARQKDETVRVKTSVLNALMEMAGELVLGRNRLVRMLEGHLDELEGVAPILQQVSAITTEIQEQVMRTRVQPIGGLFARFQRVVRDISHKLNKEVRLLTLGEDVELDRTIIEGLSDPLTHLVRNSLDHGFEPMNQREAAGKPRVGTLRLEAYHEAGMVNIDIKDDGRGLDVAMLRERAVLRDLMSLEAVSALSDREAMQLIFLPGFSTAEAVTDISGRGVGMDVVRTNITKLGGSIELSSVYGQGTTISLKLPLTLAIVTSLVIEVEGQRFALPQVGLEEVVRLKPGENRGQIERVRGAEVIRHRGRLLPVVRLADVLGLARTYLDPQTGEARPDRRQRIFDRRSGPAPSPEIEERREGQERRHARKNIKRLLVLRVGRDRFGLVVDRILASEEIVVKPLSRFLKDAVCFSGNTILGDGTISMIIDPLGIVQATGLKFSDAASLGLEETVKRNLYGDPVPLLMLDNGTDEVFALPIAQIARIEKVKRSDIEQIGRRLYLRYQGEPLPLTQLHDHLPAAAPSTTPSELHVIIPKPGEGDTGLLVPRVIDTIEAPIRIDTEAISGRGLLGSAVFNDQIVLLVDIHELGARPPRAKALKILLVEGTPFYRVALTRCLEQLGHRVEALQAPRDIEGALASGGFDAALCDVSTADFHGEALVELIRATAPKLPLFASTLTARGAPARLEGKGLRGNIGKLDRASLRAALAGVSA
ncbi:chemotaxis protein CheW [Myxococcota bacterium]|nr:chemotaxis protein CheW [Myxococcota bacterium]MBU1896285.1 chemotaxis protein CheW [Myxococcota bacterium]